MGAAEGTFDFDLELKKRSSVATILDKNSYTFNWIPFIPESLCFQKLCHGQVRDQSQINSPQETLRGPSFLQFPNIVSWTSQKSVTNKHLPFSHQEKVQEVLHLLSASFNSSPFSILLFSVFFTASHHLMKLVCKGKYLSQF